jgi:uncharacterized membrane protein
MKGVGKNRLEAFSDGVIAFMVLELKVPHSVDFRVLSRMVLKIPPG